jgi:hypothetical protein
MNAELSGCIAINTENNKNKEKVLKISKSLVHCVLGLVITAPLCRAYLSGSWPVFFL